MTCSATPTRWAVLCPKHGRVYLSEAEYERQLALVATRWTCPQACSPLDVIPDEAGICGEVCEWDDETYDTWGQDQA